jgi:tocopherol O-methyltransferase
VTASRGHEAAVAGHYDGLDDLYRRVWGEHVHHGLWRPGDGDPAALSRLVADRARVAPGDHVADVGCGYGATARLLARERGATVTGFTLSAAQAAAAPAAPGVELRVRSWLENDLPGSSCDAAIAIESISHMPDHARVFAELGRVVRPGGRVVVVDWFAGPRRGPRAARWFAEPIAREGHLPGLPAPLDHAERLRAAGLAVLGWEDLSDRVWRTWVVVARRLAALVARDRAVRATVLDPANPERPFARSLVRIPLAYRAGAMRLGVLVAERR